MSGYGSNPGDYYGDRRLKQISPSQEGNSPAGDNSSNTPDQTQNSSSHEGNSPAGDNSSNTPDQTQNSSSQEGNGRAGDNSSNTPDQTSGGTQGVGTQNRAPADSVKKNRNANQLDELLEELCLIL